MKTSRGMVAREGAKDQECVKILLEEAYPRRIMVF